MQRNFQRNCTGHCWLPNSHWAGQSVCTLDCIPFGGLVGPLHVTREIYVVTDWSRLIAMTSFTITSLAPLCRNIWFRFCGIAVTADLYSVTLMTLRYLQGTSLSKRERGISDNLNLDWIIIWQRFDSVETWQSLERQLRCEFTYRDSAKQATRKPDRLQIALIRLPSLTTMCSSRISKCLLVATKSLSTEIRYPILE